MLGVAIRRASSMAEPPGDCSSQHDVPQKTAVWLQTWSPQGLSRSPPRDSVSHLINLLINLLYSKVIQFLVLVTKNLLQFSTAAAVSYHKVCDLRQPKIILTVLEVRSPKIKVSAGLHSCLEAPEKHPFRGFSQLSEASLFHL